MNLNLILCYIFIVVGVCSAQTPLSQDTLNNVFGYPQAYGQAVQAQAITPPNGTLVDLDYWDSIDDFQQTTADYDKFDWTLTKRIAATSQDNFLLSPLGLKLALAILTEAATGPTKSELVSVLGFDLDRKVVRRKFSAILESLQTKSSHYILNLGSRIYLEDTTRPRQQFAAISQVFYKTNLTSTDFSKPAQAAADINTWVANITEGRIEKLVTEGEVAGMVVMILNTLFFKGTWRHQFPPNATAAGPFYITPKSLKTTPFMHIRDRFYYVDSVKLNAKILRMPYLGNKFSMYVIVPNSLTGLPQVLSGLGELRAELNQLREQLVDVTMPRFTFEYSSMLDGILKELGIRQAFEDTASFPGIASGQLLSRSLHVTRVMQRSGIELNELGSLAYSATEISLVNKFGEGNEEPQEVVANKPFLFFIQDEGTRQLLFTGRVSDPSVGGGLLKKA